MQVCTGFVNTYTMITEASGAMNIYDISRRAGVSIATVSRVLNNSPHVSQATRDRVMKVIEDSGYVPNAFARGLGLNSMQTIGLVCPNASDPYLAQALAFLERAFRSQGYDCLLTCTGKGTSARREGVEKLITRHVDGMVLMGSSFIESTEKGNDYIRQAARQTPIVLLNGAFPCERVYGVLCDDRRATREAAEFLMDTGCGRILYLYDSKNDSGRRKLAGLREALAARNAGEQEELQAFFDGDKQDIARVREYLLALDRAGTRFDAVLASEDSLAVGALKYARAAGRRVPEDVSIVGYNNSALCLYSEPELTSVDNKLRAICDRIVETMMGVLEGREMPQKTVFTAELVKRGSTRQAENEGQGGA